MPESADRTHATSNLWPHILMYFAKSLGYKEKPKDRKQDTVDMHDNATNDELGPGSLETEEMLQDEGKAAEDAAHGDGEQPTQAGMHPKLHQLRKKLNSLRDDEEDLEDF